MELKYGATYHGPNPYADEPVLVARLLAKTSAPELEAACSRLQGVYHEWLSKGGLPVAATTVQRAAHTAACWALSALNEVRGYLHHAGAVTDTFETGALADGEASLFLAYHHEAVSRHALELGVKALAMAGGDASFSRQTMQPALEHLWDMCRKHHPDYQARILMQGARAMDVPVQPAWGHARHWQFGWGERSRVMFESSSIEDGSLGARIAGSKAASKAAMRALGVPTPRHALVSNIAELTAAAKKVGWPCVTKPLNRGGGKGVSAGLSSMQDLQAGFVHAKNCTDGPVMVEQFVRGHDHRLMVVDGRLMAAIRREAASVVGDGHRSVRELVDEQNTGRFAHNLVGSSYLRRIALDAPALQHLATQGATPDTVPSRGLKLSLRSNANVSTGGGCTDVTGQLHPHVRRMAESMARSFGLYSTGFDYLTTDISQSWESAGGAFIEFNCTPGLDAIVVAGWSPVDVARQVLGTVPGRVPVTLLVVPDETLSEVQSALAGQTWAQGQGWVCDGAAQLGGMPLQVKPARGWADVRTLLHHRSLEQAILVCGAQQVQRLGLPVDKVERVVLCGAILPSAWQALLARRSLHVENHAQWVEGINHHLARYTGQSA